MIVNFPSSPCESLSSKSEVDGFKSMPGVFTSQPPREGDVLAVAPEGHWLIHNFFLVKDVFIISFFKIFFFQISNLGPENKDLCFYFGV